MKRRIGREMKWEGMPMISGCCDDCDDVRRQTDKMEACF